MWIKINDMKGKIARAKEDCCLRSAVLCVYSPRSPRHSKYVFFSLFSWQTIFFSPHLVHISFTFSVIWLQSLPFSDSVTIWVRITFTSTSAKVFLFLFFLFTHHLIYVSFACYGVFWASPNASCATYAPGNLHVIGILAFINIYI